MNLTNSALDAALQLTLTRIEEQLPLFGRVFGRVRVDLVKGVDKVATAGKDRPRRLPLFWDVNKKTNTPIVPDEKQNGLLFVVTTGAATIVEAEPGWVLQSKQQTKRYPLAILAWWDSSKPDQSNDPNQVQQIIEQELGKNYAWQTISVDDQLATRVFRDIDYDFDNHAYLVFPFSGLRIEGILTISEANCN